VYFFLLCIFQEERVKIESSRAISSHGVKNAPSLLQSDGSYVRVLQSEVWCVHIHVYSNTLIYSFSDGLYVCVLMGEIYWVNRMGFGFMYGIYVCVCRFGYSDGSYVRVLQSEV